MKDLMLRMHIFREETIEVGPGLDWISPESRMRIETRMLLVQVMRERGRVMKNESGMVSSDAN